MSNIRANYPKCSHLQRQKPNFSVISPELKDEVSKDYRVIPSFEKSIYDRICRDHYSLENNDFLRCRWKSYKENMDKRVFEPFQFVRNSDFHFYLCQTRLVPSETVTRRSEFRNKLKVGPGVDFRGQMPVPNELFLKRGDPQKHQKVMLKGGDGIRAMEKRCGKKMHFTLEPKVDFEAILKKRAADKVPEFEKAGMD